MSLLAHRACAARPAHAAPVRLRPAGPHGRTAASGAHPQADAHRAPARGRVGRGGTRRRPPRRVPSTGCCTDPNTPLTRGAPAVQRQLPRHGHERRRRLQPLARPGRHPLARGCHLRRLRHLHLPARSPAPAATGRPPISPRGRSPSATRRSSSRRARSTAGSITPSKRTPRSACRPKTTSRSAASRSPTCPTTPRDIEVTSYAEVVMAPLNADLAHRAFSNLFVQTEILPGHRAILCRRRPRTPDEQTPWMFHMLAAPGCARRGSLVRDRPRPVHRPGKNGRESGGASTTATARRPVEHRGLRPRSHRGDPQHAEVVSGRVPDRARDLRRGGDPRSGRRSAREVSRPALRRAGVRDGLVREPGGASPPQHHRGGRPDLWPAGHVRSSTRAPPGGPPPASSLATSSASPGSGASASRETCPSCWCASATSIASTW